MGWLEVARGYTLLTPLYPALGSIGVRMVAVRCSVMARGMGPFRVPNKGSLDPSPPNSYPTDPPFWAVWVLRQITRFRRSWTSRDHRIRETIRTLIITVLPDMLYWRVGTPWIRHEHPAATPRRPPTAILEESGAGPAAWWATGCPGYVLRNVIKRYVHPYPRPHLGVSGGVRIRC